MDYAVALVYDWLLKNPEHYSVWVSAYLQRRAVTAIRVGGHWRKLEGWGDVLGTLKCVCKFEVLSVPRALPPPMSAVRMRVDEAGNVIPRKYRVLVLV